MEAYRKRLYKDQLVKLQAVCGIDFLWQSNDKFRHRPISLDTKSFVKAAGIRPPPTACSAGTTTLVRRYSHVRSRFDDSVSCYSPGLYRSRDLMSKNSGVRYERIAPPKRTEICPTQPNHSNTQQQFVGLRMR